MNIPARIESVGLDYGVPSDEIIDAGQLGEVGQFRHRVRRTDHLLGSFWLVQFRFGSMPYGSTIWARSAAFSWGGDL